MSQKILLDSNIVIGILNKTLRVAQLPPVGAYFVSAITVMEVCALPGLSVLEETQIDAILSTMNILPITSAEARLAGTMSRTRRTGKPDLLIAASALLLDATLITQNIRDFKNIPGLLTRAI